jgi:hypothetical protein
MDTVGVGFGARPAGVIARDDGCFEAENGPSYELPPPAAKNFWISVRILSAEESFCPGIMQGGAPGRGERRDRQVGGLNFLMSTAA